MIGEGAQDLGVLEYFVIGGSGLWWGAPPLTTGLSNSNL